MTLLYFKNIIQKNFTTSLIDFDILIDYLFFLYQIGYAFLTLTFGIPPCKQCAMQVGGPLIIEVRPRTTQNKLQSVRRCVVVLMPAYVDVVHIYLFTGSSNSSCFLLSSNSSCFLFALLIQYENGIKKILIYDLIMILFDHRFVLKLITLKIFKHSIYRYTCFSWTVPRRINNSTCSIPCFLLLNKLY